MSRIFSIFNSLKLCFKRSGEHVKYIFFFLLGTCSALSAQSPCPGVSATCATACSASPIQLNATAGFTTYSWSPASGLSNPAIANPVASASGTYTVIATSLGTDLVINGDFAAGNTGFNSGQIYSTTYTPGNYWVGAQWFVTWFPGLTDHTPTTDNMFMQIDGGSPATMLWEEVNLPVFPNTNYTFGFWASRADQVQPIFDMYFVGNNTGLASMGTVPGIPYTGTWMWDQYGVPLWNSGSNTSVTVRIINLQTNGYGNDFGMDDFTFQPLCSDTDSVQVTIAMPPDIGPDTSLCQNTTLSLNAGSANSYLWNTGDTTQFITVSSTGQYYVTNTTGACSLTDTIDVTVVSLPPLDLGADTILCSNSSLELDATSLAQSTYTWSTGDLTPTILANSSGTYSVTVAVGNCFIADSINITVTAVLDLGSDVALCSTPHALFDAGNPGATYLWSNGATSQTIDVNEPGEYWVQLTNGACVLSDTIEASGSLGEGMLYVPNSFTPNRNGLNDKFYAYGDGITSFRMRIFNRWGQLIFETTDMSEGWDGKYKGETVLEDTYVYVMDYESQCTAMESKKVYGHVNVIR
jgi:gliding motility-associated-like protein